MGIRIAKHALVVGVGPIGRVVFDHPNTRVLIVAQQSGQFLGKEQGGPGPVGIGVSVGIVLLADQETVSNSIIGAIGGYKAPAFFLSGTGFVDVGISLEKVVELGYGRKTVPAPRLIGDHLVVVQTVPDHVAHTGSGIKDGLRIHIIGEQLKVTGLKFKTGGIDLIHQRS